MDKITLSTLGTYKEIEYLKKTLGPVLVSALAEVCVKRPADPIEYLGHWLLRWRYNEELKRRDMENALEVIRQRQAAKCEREMNMPVCRLPLDPYGQGVIPNYPFLPPGYGGPVCDSDLEALLPKEDEEEEVDEVEVSNYEMPGEDFSFAPGLTPGEDGYFGYADQQQPLYDYNNLDPGTYPQDNNANNYYPDQYQPDMSAPMDPAQEMYAPPPNTNVEYQPPPPNN
ncbi:unnamed protein product [Allacma fusca]|uniref:DPY30 domain-containing protein 2 n=1 Tax=Allacma fusca TaxID=39272 RepID=A0A8J2JZL0_9HEXA|nr:unnamed protein product [Allacma fusca]